MPDRAFQETLEHGFHVIEGLIELGVLQNVNPHKLYTQSSGLIVPVQCADAKDNRVYFQGKQATLGLPHQDCDMFELQFIGGPLWASPEWWNSPRWGATLLELSSAFGTPIENFFPDKRHCTNFFYLQIALAHKATGRTCFPYVPHYPCKACFLTDVDVCYELAQLLDAVYLFRQRFSKTNLTTIPLYHVHWDDAALGMKTYFVDCTVLKRLPALITTNPELLPRYFKTREEFEKTRKLIFKNCQR